MESCKEMMSGMSFGKHKPDIVTGVLLTICLLLGTLDAHCAGISPAAARTDVRAFPDNDDRFAKWTEEDYRHHEDSIRSILYSPVTIHKADSASFAKGTETLPQDAPSAMVASHVPSSIDLDMSKEVGEIPINSGTSPAGAKTYEIPIDVYQGMKGFKPRLSFAYDSRQGSSVMGTDWSVSGLSMISRCGKTVYYDGIAQGIVMDNSDNFVLDGVRLIRKGAGNDHILYESEQGNIKAKGYFSGNTIRYFDVFYPDGNRGVFGYADNARNQLYYPLVSLTDLNGNTIAYSYSFSDNHYTISSISYNGASVEFQYKTSRQDPILHFAGGLKVYDSKLLQSVICRLGSTELGTYTLQYSEQNGRTFLTGVDYTASGKSYNPLLFYYGKGEIAPDYTARTTKLTEWYEAEKPSMIKVVKGKFDYGSGADGLIALPNLNPYWKHYRHSTMFRHSQNRFDNMYTGNEKIFLYAGLDGDWAFPMPDLYTEYGFVDIICADLEGEQEEDVIKINNYVENDNDKVVFNVYRSDMFTGLRRRYTRTYSFPTVYTDADGGKSIQPKFYYAGDFNGDGKMEVMAVSVHQPFGDTGKPSMCYIFDLDNDKIIYQGHVLPYNVDFVGVQQSDAQAAVNNSDKLFVMDYDGDGKSDLCQINEDGVTLYTFSASGNTLVPQKAATYTGLKKSGYANCEVLLGEFNGDAMMDILLSPAKSKYWWTVYNSKGDGQFESSEFSGTKNDTGETTGFLIQDINSDGVTDMIKYHGTGFSTYLAKDNRVGSYTLHYPCRTSNSVFIPTYVNSRNSFTQLVSMEKGIVTRYSFSRNDNKESMVTGMVNSLGVIEKNSYALINAGQTDNEDATPYILYTKGYGATFPYVNIMEPLPVLSSSELYMNGEQADKSYFTYNNAVIHRQGLGFRGFEQVTSYDKRGQSTVRTYEPYRFCLLKSEVSPVSENSYTYSVSVQPDRIAKVRLTERVTKDLLKKTSATASYKYDSYGYPTEEDIAYSDNTRKKTVNTYTEETYVGHGYYLGFLTEQTVTLSYNGSSYSECMLIPMDNARLPQIKVYYKDGNQVKLCHYEYDNHGNLLKEKVMPYNDRGGLTTLYEYDSYGRIARVTNPMGLTNEYGYDSSGRLASLKDHRNNITTYEYDSFGRERRVSYPDGTTATTDFAWNRSATNGLYSITNFKTGRQRLLYTMR
ncbi:MAG: hypothetical protein NC344_04795 [Bacteroidales bacterium]|nr:hypothetical protein [Bacteroidales bacterium]MCM1147143.1 hypothetical protein [Bacteroidales bacterium]MCM1205369.1 hypothetical protein [Bacillota bacterium]MCM1509826.1 hypothetical protein [Clostridium sp.]